MIHHDPILFQCSSKNIAMFLDLLGDQRLRPAEDCASIIIDGKPDGPSSFLGRELLKCMQPFLVHAYFAAGKWKGKDASFPFYHHPCGEWRLQTRARSKSQCSTCVDPKDRKHPKSLIRLPWADDVVNAHGRTDIQHRIISKEEANAISR